MTDLAPGSPAPEAPAEPELPPAFVACGRCGIPIQVNDQEVLRILQVQPVPMFHSSCEDAAPTGPARKFRVTVLVEEVFEEPGEALEDGSEGEPVEVRVEEVTKVAAEAEGASFVTAFPDLERRLGELWQRVQQYGMVVDGRQPPKEHPPERALILPR